MADVGERKDPFRNSRFKLEILGIEQAGFSECTGLESTTDAVDYREGTDPATMRKLPGLTKHGNITLKWGVTDSDEIWEWRKLVVDGKSKEASRNGSIVILDEEGTEQVRWNFRRAWPSKYKAADMNAKSNDVAIDTLEITFEALERG
jgi:phage tail-like protein